MVPNRAGNSGRYFRVLKFDSEYGLSLELYGREIHPGQRGVCGNPP
jgi:hypothetical protein